VSGSSFGGWDDERLDEQLLRRALRLETDEVPPRLDAAVIAAAARSGRLVFGGSDLRSRDVALVAGVAFLGGWLSSELSRVAIGAVTSLVGVDPLALAIEVIAAGAVRLAPLAEILTAPAIPLAIGAAAMLAFAFEQRRSRAHA
jgi:hypothetical protein